MNYSQIAIYICYMPFKGCSSPYTLSFQGTRYQVPVEVKGILLPGYQLHVCVHTSTTGTKLILLSCLHPRMRPNNCNTNTKKRRYIRNDTTTSLKKGQSSRLERKLILGHKTNVSLYYGVYRFRLFLYCRLVRFSA